MGGGAAVVVFGEEVERAARGNRVAARHDLRVDAQEDVRAVSGPLADLCGIDASGESAGRRRMAGGVGLCGERRDRLVGRESACPNVDLVQDRGCRRTQADVVEVAAEGDEPVQGQGFQPASPLMGQHDRRRPRSRSVRRWDCSQRPRP